MRHTTFYVLAFFTAVLAGCAGGRALKSGAYFHNGWYWYEFPCISWKEPARVVVNQPAGVADTTLALVSGRVVNFTRSTYTDSLPMLLIAQRDTVPADPKPANSKIAFADQSGHYSFFLAPGVYSIEFMGFPSYWPLTVEHVPLQAGKRHRLDVFLRETVSNAGSCVHKSRRPYTQAKLDTLLARQRARWVRDYKRGAKKRAAADARSALE